MAINFNRRAPIICLLLLAALSASSPTALPRSTPSNEKVQLTLYYETLCHGCSYFIVNDLIKLVRDEELLNIVDLRLVPYGNALIFNGSIICQHGDEECMLNTVEACVIDVLPSLSQHYSFIDCVEKLVYNEKSSKWGSCFKKLGIDRKPVAKCYTGNRGKELELKYAAETDSLRPPHEYVPWVTVNGEPIGDDFENYIAYICKAYKGSQVPKVCSGLSHTRNPSDGSSSKLSICVRKD